MILNLGRAEIRAANRVRLGAAAAIGAELLGCPADRAWFECANPYPDDAGRTDFLHGTHASDVTDRAPAAGGF